MNELLVALIGVAGTTIVAVVAWFGQRKSASQQHELSLYDRVIARNNELEDDTTDLRKEHNAALDQIDELLASIREKDRKNAELSRQLNERQHPGDPNPPSA